MFLVENRYKIVRERKPPHPLPNVTMTNVTIFHLDSKKKREKKVNRYRLLALGDFLPNCFSGKIINIQRSVGFEVTI